MAVHLSGAATLDVEGETYILDNDFACVGTAFTVTADNIKLNVNGHAATYGSGGAAAYGVYCTAANFEVYGGGLTQHAAGAAYGHAVYQHYYPGGSSGEGIKVHDCTLTTIAAAASGVRAMEVRAGTQIHDNIINTALLNAGIADNQVATGIYLVNNSVKKPTSASARALVYKNTINCVRGLFIGDCSYLDAYENALTPNSPPASAKHSKGIVLWNADYCRFWDNPITSTSGGGICCQGGAADNTFTDCPTTIADNEANENLDGIYVRFGAVRNAFTRCHVAMNSSALEGSPIRFNCLYLAGADEPGWDTTRDNVFDDCDLDMQWAGTKTGEPACAVKLYSSPAHSAASGNVIKNSLIKSNAVLFALWGVVPETDPPNLVKSCAIERGSSPGASYKFAHCYDGGAVTLLDSPLGVGVSYSDVFWHDGGGEITVQWYLTVTVRDQGGAPLVGASVEVTDSTSALVSSGLTNGSGQHVATVTAAVYTEAGIIGYNPHLAAAALAGYASDSESATVNSSMGVELQLVAEEAGGEAPGIEAVVEPPYARLPADGLGTCRLGQIAGEHPAAPVPSEIPSHMAALAENVFWRGGRLWPRPGATKLTGLEWDGVVTGPVVGLHWHRDNAGVSELLAASATQLWRWDGAYWRKVGSGITSTKRVNFASAKGNCYIATGQQAVQRWDGSSLLSLAQLSGPATAPVVTSDDWLIDDMEDCDTAWTQGANVHWTKSRVAYPVRRGSYTLKCTNDGTANSEYVQRDYTLLDLSGAIFLQLSASVSVAEEGFRLGLVDTAGKAVYLDWRGQGTSGLMTFQDVIALDLRPFRGNTAAIDLSAVRYLRVYAADATQAYDLHLDNIRGMGGLDGNYQYRYCYYNQTTDRESPPSPATNPEATDEHHGGFVLVGLSSLEAGADKVRIYRIGGGSQKWRLLTEFANPAAPTWTYTDRISDDQTGDEQVEHQEPPPQASVLCWHAQRMWYDDPEHPGRVCVSPWGQPEICPPITQVAAIDTDGGFIDVGRPDGAIRGFCPYADHLVVGKSNGVWRIMGGDFSEFYVECLVADVGIASQASMVLSNGRLYWLGADRRVWVYDGTQAMPCREQIALPDFTLDEARLTEAAGCAFDGRMFQFGRRVGQSYPDKAFFLEHRDDSWGRLTGWTPSVFVVRDNNRGFPEAWFGDASAGYVWQAFTGYTDGASPVSWQYITKSLDFDEPDVVHRVRALRLTAEVADAPVSTAWDLRRDQQWRNVVAHVFEGTAGVLEAETPCADDIFGVDPRLRLYGDASAALVLGPLVIKYERMR